MDLNTSEVEVHKALAEFAGVPVESLKVKARRPVYGGTQMAIVTMPRANALADHRYRSGPANGTALVKAKDRLLRKGNG